MYFDRDAILSEPAGEGATRKVLAHSENLMIVEVTFEKDADGAPHSHPHEQASYVAEGEILFRLNGEEHRMKQGDSVYIPGDLPHCLRALTPAVVIDVFTPERKDFLK